MTMNTILGRLLPLGFLLAFAVSPAAGQRVITGKVVDGAGNALPDAEVRVFNIDGTKLDVKTTGPHGDYTLNFPNRDTIYVTYKHKDLAEETVPNLSGKTNHFLTKVLARPSIARVQYSDQSTTDSASLENAASNSCQTQFAELGFRSGSQTSQSQSQENRAAEPKDKKD